MIGDHEARVNITFAGVNGDLPDPVTFDATDGDIKTWVAEALSAGGIPGIEATGEVDLSAYVVERLPAKPDEDRPTNILLLRPKTPFGS